MRNGLIVLQLETKRYIIFFLLLIICLGIYGNTLQNKFVFDDHALIIDNVYIKYLKHLPHILTVNTSYFSSNQSGSYYRPLQIITYMLDYAIWKLKPFGYHLTNIILHTINGYLIYILLVSLFARPRFALTAAILFSIHPIHTSAVSYISGRADLLVTLFILLSVIEFLRYIETQKIKEYIASLVFFALALLSRENAVLMPFLIILLCIKNKIRDKHIFLVITGFFILDAFYIINRVYLDRYLGLFRLQDRILSFPLELINVMNVLREYFSLLIFPWPLYPMRTTPFIKNLTGANILFILAFIFLVILFIIKDIIKKEKLLSFGLTWFILGFLPITRLMYTRPNLGAFMAEHWLYLPSIGIFTIIGFLLCSYQKFPKLVFVFIFCFYSSLTILNNKIWKDELTLYTHTLRFSPHNTGIRCNLANFYYTQGLYDKAIDELKLILIREPNFWNIYLGLGNVYSAKDEIEKAIWCYKRVLMLNPGCSQAYNNLGIVYEMQGEAEEAVTAFLKALEINPESWIVYENLGGWYLKRHIYSEAINMYEKALNLNPDNEKVKRNIEKIEKLMEDRGKIKDEKD